VLRLQAQLRGELAERTAELHQSTNSLEQMQSELERVRDTLSQSMGAAEEAKRQITHLAGEAAKWESEATQLATDVDRTRKLLERKEDDLKTARQWASVEVLVCGSLLAFTCRDLLV
jgi:methyl-accepting chemotaxis protein